MSVIGVWLHLKSRGAQTILVVTPLLLACQWAIGSRTVPLPLGNGARAPLGILLPVVTGTVLATVMSSTLPERERLAARNITALTRFYVLGISILAALGTAAATAQLDSGYTGISTGRNTALITGIAMVAASLFGASAAWILPVVYTGIVITTGGTPNGPAWWALPLHPDGSQTAQMTAILILILGSTLLARPGGLSPKRDT